LGDTSDRTHHPVWHDERLGDGKPERAEAEEGARGTEEEDRPGRDAVGDHPGQEPDVLADVVAEHCEGPLVVAERIHDGVRVEQEDVGAPRRHLHPHRRRQPHPWRPAARLAPPFRFPPPPAMPPLHLTAAAA
jgi:hypothetical protein